jgi:hypothetical protein
MSIVMDESIRVLIFAPFADRADMMVAIKEAATTGRVTVTHSWMRIRSHGLKGSTRPRLSRK